MEKMRGGVIPFLESTGLNYEMLKEGSQRKDGEIVSYRYTYYDYDAELQQYTTNPRFICSIQTLPYDKTALIVIDPWKDSPFEEINAAVGNHVQNYLLPVVTHAIDNDLHVYIFTNNPDLIDYDTKIEDSLQNLIDNNKVFLYYYDDYAMPETFVKEMEMRGIENLIFTGYSTHLCLLFRSTGIIELYHGDKQRQINLFIIPEATLAFVTSVEEINNQMRNNICTMLSQQEIAYVITWDDFMEY